MALLLAAAAAVPPLATPANLTDFMGERCDGWHDPRMGDKLGQVTVGSYVRGAAETVANACDHGARYAACARIRARKVDAGALAITEIAPRYDRLCAGNPRPTLRQIAQRILADAGYSDAPRAEGR